MPRLQVTRRTSLLSTNLRTTFLEAFGRNVSARSTNAEARGVSDPIDLHAVARRIQAEIHHASGRYCPLHQVISSIHDLKRDDLGTISSYVSSTTSSTPDSVRIVITTTTNTPDMAAVNSSMSRRRTARNLPALHCQLPLPPAGLPWPSTTAASPSPSLTPTCLIPPIISSLSPSSGSEGSYPITPIDQIVHTPLTPPKLPRLVPPPPRTWARLNAQARKGESSPLGTPTLPLSPYLLGPMGTAKPTLDRLHIPDAPTGEVRFLTAQPTPSPQALSPFDLGIKGYFPAGFSSTFEGNIRLTPVRTTSSSELARTALLRSTCPSGARRFSNNLGVATDRVGSPSAPLAGAALSSPLNGQPLASPFIIRSEAVDGEYFRT
ncbi:hypothetical protein DICSQDRAFT_181603 [Dichomitus squalens LYAD-421 SS1]|uniref:Uncharacterized protein n=2 Tax=Dichomitus squalens TaxID=114155 RepID=A0A4Q9MN94_9APHY|nr:uncharacterized protein DICSQDRAFT_181603 [Dichomitus squalens LYAD-421 SS1]EJF60045.1 hypothetical protein DICSQDRAFT_181603 [Dichomitus squalens LYAD-421 SS1]TBU29164.1 hypothetical protein BD311DRAFT_757084 [Dichomitus squalens]